jgi:tRNA modification GTPase
MAVKPRPIPEDTIAAVSTPPGEGGIGIVRLSGDKAIAIADTVFVSATGKRPSNDRRRVYYGEVQDDDAVVDEVLLHVMRAPYTYTREDVVEINCHGGTGPVQAILDLVLRQGARLAKPGEFTKRAFLNGRIDLVQAEAVIDRIQARTRAGLRSASAAAHGSLSKSIHDISARLVHASARIEAAVDFPDDDLPELVDDVLRSELTAALDAMRELLRTADAGRLLREGATVAIAGRPNVGKSSLFNALLRDTRAIVTAQPGTTRDRIEDYITIEGIPVRLIDLAGIRQADDEVERIGVAMARETLGQADAILFVVDVSEPLTREDEKLARELSEADAPALLIGNKIDRVDSPTEPAWSKGFTATRFISALAGTGLPDLEQALAKLLLGDASVAPDQALVTRLHQRDSLRRAAEAVERLLGNFEASPEFLAIELKDAIQALGEITGETTPDEILEQVFAQFCIGK